MPVFNPKFWDNSPEKESRATEKAKEKIEEIDLRVSRVSRLFREGWKGSRAVK
jgi:hypothetical protein